MIVSTTTVEETASDRDTPTLVAVTGASGRLGAAIVRTLAADGLAVRALDIVPGVHPPTVEAGFLDVTNSESIDRALDGVDVLLHVAGLHGAHLAAGTRRSEIWHVNVDGTWRLLRAARRLRRVVFASSMSVYGPGSGSGHARVLDEDVTVGPEDVYDITKVLGERMLNDLNEEGTEAVALRLGRFYYGNRYDYHLRKLATGLDLQDATSAFLHCVRAPSLPRRAYCVASDLEMSYEQRARLGTDLSAVVEEVLPGLLDTLHRLGYPVPERYGKSVATNALRQDLGWRPERDLSWWFDQLTREVTQCA
jgi:nucleoside-diphosphate-sugar epimerase